MRHGQRIRILMNNFEIHESRLKELRSAMNGRNAVTTAVLQRQYDEHLYLAKRYALLIVQAEEERVRRIVERKN